jgi:hypothetical protein
MRTRERRLKRLEAKQIWAEVRATAAEFGIDAQELLDETRHFFALPEAEQDAELEASIAQAEADGDTEHVRILTEGWAAIRSSR